MLPTAIRTECPIQDLLDLQFGTISTRSNICADTIQKVRWPVFESVGPLHREIRHAYSAISFVAVVDYNTYAGYVLRGNGLKNHHTCLYH